MTRSKEYNENDICIAHTSKPSMDKLPKCSSSHFGFMLRMFTSEAMGTAMVTFVIVMASAQIQNSTVVALAVGLTFTWIGWMFGPISGAQVNPAVTLALFFTRRLSIFYMLLMFVAEFIGSLIGAIVGKCLLPQKLAEISKLGMSVRNPSTSIGQCIGIEILGTMCIIMLVLSTGDEFRPKLWSNGLMSTFPFVFGVTLTLVCIVLGSLSGGSFNPARSFGPAVVSHNYDELWIYFVAPFIGSILSTILFEMILSNGISLARLKAWFTRSDFDRTVDYNCNNHRTSES